MAIGDTADQTARLKRYLPPWFPDSDPILLGLLTGIASVMAFAFQLIAFAAIQTRISTATGGWLDLIAQDFFGANTRRGAGQSDASFRNEIVVNLFRPRATRASIIQVLQDLTGNTPDVFEPSRVQDTGAYALPCMGYGSAGRYGSLLLPFQAFVTAKRPAGSGIPSVAGYGSPTGGYSAPSRAEYASLSMVLDAVTDDDIYAAVDGVRPVGTTMWVQIANGYRLPSIAPDFSLLLGSGPIHFGSSTSPIRLLGWSL